MFVIANLSDGRLKKNCRFFNLDTYFNNPGIRLDYWRDYLVFVDHDVPPVRLQALKREHLEGPLRDYLGSNKIKELVGLGARSSYLDKKTTAWLLKYIENNNL